MLVVYLAMQFEPDLSNAGAPDAPNFLKHKPLGIGEVVAAPDGRETRTLVRGTWGTEVLPQLAPEEGDLVVAKHHYSGFFETELHAILRERGIDSLVFTGCTTSVCVDSRGVHKPDRVTGGGSSCRSGVGVASSGGRLCLRRCSTSSPAGCCS
jgi:ureidoacrylate peracid hydrolase